MEGLALGRFGLEHAAPQIAVQPPVIAPAPDTNRVAKLGLRSGRDLARQIAEQHRKHLRARRRRDLTCEKYLLHIDGEGDAQWADVLGGSRVEIPRDLHPFREQENLLRLIADNAVAYHTTMPFRFLADGGYDRKRRESAQFDTGLANHLAREQRLNSLSAQAFYMAIAAGFCPMHLYCRDDLDSDPYEPLYLSQEEWQKISQQFGVSGIRACKLDAWVGNPFDHSFNPGAKRDSVQAQWYGRVLPLKWVEKQFAEVLSQQRVKLHGTTRLPSASVFQRIARSWATPTGGLHGTAALMGAETNDEELIAIVCREIPPGIDSEYPNGRLTIAALQGETSTLAEGRHASSVGEAIQLADQKLPAGCYSSENVYSHHRFDDIHGKPWIADPDQAQVQLNLTLSDEKEYIHRAKNAPTIVGGALVEDSVEYDAYTILEMEPGVTIPPRTIDLPQSPARLLKIRADSLREYIFRVGGYQAASRGEGFAGDSAAKVVALAEADDTIHGPINVVFRDSMERFVGKGWRLFKEYGDVGTVLEYAGEDLAHLADAYVDRTRLSDRQPQFKMVSGYGATPETQGQQLMTLATTRGADGIPLLDTPEFRRRWPDQTLYHQSWDEKASQRARARTIAQKLLKFVEEFRQQTGFAARGMGDPQVAQIAYQVVFQHLEKEFPRLRDDDPAEHVASLSEITQDESEDPLARWAASFRQAPYYDVLQMLAASRAMAQGGGGGAQGGNGEMPSRFGHVGSEVKRLTAGAA